MVVINLKGAILLVVVFIGLLVLCVQAGRALERKSQEDPQPRAKHEHRFRCYDCGAPLRHE